MIEKRFVDGAELELRAVSGGGESASAGPVVEGYVALFNRWSPVYDSPWGPWRERIAPGFFDAALGRDDVLALWNHDTTYVLGRVGNETLSLGVDEKGLRMVARVPETQTVDDLVLAPMRRGDVRGASFSFTLPDLPDGGAEKWERSDDGILERTLVQVGRLFDVGPVAAPFYPETDVSARALERLGLVRPPAVAFDARQIETFRLRLRAISAGRAR